MAEQIVGNLVFETTGAGVERELQVAAGPDILTTPANAHATLLSQLGASLREGLAQLAEIGTPRTYSFSGSAADSTALVFTVSAIDGSRTLDVGLYSYRSLADERRNYISSGVVSTEVLNDLASWFDSTGRLMSQRQ